MHFRYRLTIGFIVFLVVCMFALLSTHQKNVTLRENDNSKVLVENFVVAVQEKTTSKVQSDSQSTKNWKTRQLKIALTEIESELESAVGKVIDNTRKIIFIITTWRSGSTFFAEALCSHPLCFYHYEPLSRFKFQELSTGSLSEAVSDIESLINCNYDSLNSYLENAKSDVNILKFNEKLRIACEFLQEECFNPIFTTSSCKMFPIQVFKFVRLPLSALKIFLKISNNTHIILLTRDPRAIYSSRLKLDWCVNVSQCIEPKNYCYTMAQDFDDFKDMKLSNPSQLHLVKYEDVAFRPVVTFRNIFKELNINWHQNVQDHIEYHTRREQRNSWSTYRISHTRINIWKTELQTELVKNVQLQCNDIMSKLNYSLIDTKSCKKFCN